MATVSRPAVGNDGFDENDWLTYFNSGDGIVDDYLGGGVSGFALTRVDASNVARFAPHEAGARIDGYRLQVTSQTDLAISTTAATYRILVKYDPALNVADGSGNANPAGPCSLVVLTGTPPTGGGEKYLLLYEIIRAAGQALSVATVIDYRRWVGPSISWAWGVPSPPVGAALYPRGTLRYDAAFDRLMVRELSPAGTSLIWRAVGTTDPLPFPAAAGIGPAHILAEYWMGPGRTIHLTGTVDKNNGSKLGSATAVVTLGTLPVGFRPADSRHFVVFSQGNADGIARLIVAATGVVTLRTGTGAEDIDWLALDGVTFKAADPT
jgi:hypothetical protein